MKTTQTVYGGHNEVLHQGRQHEVITDLLRAIDTELDIARVERDNLAESSAPANLVELSQALCSIADGDELACWSVTTWQVSKLDTEVLPNLVLLSQVEGLAEMLDGLLALERGEVVTATSNHLVDSCVTLAPGTVSGGGDPWMCGTDFEPERIFASKEADGSWILWASSIDDYGPCDTVQLSVATGEIVDGDRVVADRAGAL